MTVRAVLWLALAVLAAAPLGTAHAQPFGRLEWRVAERPPPRAAALRPRAPAPVRRMAAARAAARAAALPPAAYGPAPVYAYPPAAARQPYAPPPSVYAPPTAPAPRPGYAPNSLGADWGQQQDAARRGVRQGALAPLARVIANIRQGTPGRILDAGLETAPDGRPAYRVRWAAANGQRIDFIVDAATGAVIGSSGF